MDNLYLFSFFQPLVFIQILSKTPENFRKLSKMSEKKNPSWEGAGSAENNIAEVASPATTEASTPMEGAGIEQVQDETMENVMGTNENLLAQLLNTSAAMDIEGGGEGGAADSATRSNEQGRTSQ